MKINQLEQSGLIIEADNGYKLAIDVGSYTPIEKLVSTSVDAMIASHIHGDHFSPSHIKKLSPKKVYLNQECIDAFGQEKLPFGIIKVKIGDSIETSGMRVTFFDVDHGPNVKLRPKENFGLLIEADGKKVYFAGDMFYPSGIDVKSLEVDIAFIPVGTFYTFGPHEALEFAKQFKRIRKVTPMHYVKEPKTREEFIKLAVAAGLNTDSFIL